MEDEVRLRDLIRAMWRVKWHIIWTTLLVMSATATVSLMMPKIYRASATLVPPEVDVEWPTADGMKTRFGAAALGGAIRPNNSATDIIAGILKSRRVALAVIKRFNLTELYPSEAVIKLSKLPWQEEGSTGKLTDILEELADRTEVKVTKDGLLTISVDDHNPQRAADMVQCYLDELNRVNVDLQTTYNLYLARVLDPPIPPDKKTKPRTTLNTLISGVVVGFLWTMITLLRLTLSAPATLKQANAQKAAAH
jgi:tyrosine-protein kinase Etk/Wzc